MTNSSGDGQPPQDPDQPVQPGYWEQQSQQPYQQQPQPGYGQPPYQQPMPYGQAPGYPVQFAPEHPQATTSLVLGIIGLVLCSVVAPFAWRLGKRTLDEIDASQGQVGGRGAAQAGYVLGIIGTVVLGLALLVIVGYGVVVVAILGAGLSNA
ncbi:MAG: DUF4190 domain-containing protein [Nocardioidaceae bacterium]